MPLHKWCRFLMRTMSPLAVGLISFLLIEFSSSSSYHLHNPSGDSSALTTLGAEVKFKNHAIHPPLAKDYKFHRTRLSIDLSRPGGGSSSRPEHGFGKNVGNKSKISPSLSLGSRSRIQNGSGQNGANKQKTAPSFSFNHRSNIENSSGETDTNNSRNVTNLSFSSISRTVNKSSNNSDTKSRTVPNLRYSSNSNSANTSGKYSNSKNRTVPSVRLRSRSKIKNISGEHNDNRNISVPSWIHSSWPKIKNESAKHIGNRNTNISRLDLNTRPLSEKGSSNRSRTLPSLSLSSRFKVKNGTNSTVVFFPRYGRAMTNLSEPSVRKDLLPVIVSSNRRILLEPNDYKLKTESDAKNLSRREIPPQLLGFPQRKRTLQNFTTTKPRKVPLKYRESPSVNRDSKTNSYQNVGSLFKTENFREPISESTGLVRIESPNKNVTYIKKNSTILTFMKFKDKIARNISQNHRRQGRNFDFSKESSMEDEETSSEIKTSDPIPKTTNPYLKSRPELSKLFNYAYYSGIQRNLTLLTSTQPSLQESKDSTLPSTLFTSLMDTGSSYSEKKANNLTIYEILKPRLKISAKEYSNHSPILSKFDAPVDQNKEIMDISNTSDIFVSNTGNVDNVTAEINSADNKTLPFGSIMILPSRSDSNYAIEYVMVNRNNSAIVSQLNKGEASLDKSIAFSKDIINNSTVNETINSNEKGSKSILNPKADDPQQEHIIESHIQLQKNLPRLNPEHTINSSKPVVLENGSMSALSKLSKAEDSEYMTELYESDSMRRIKIPARSMPSTESNVSAQQELLRLKSDDNTYRNRKPTTSANSLQVETFSGDLEYVTQLYDSDSIRNPKMSADNTPFKNLKMDSKIFYDYFAKKPIGNVTLQDFPYPEFRPGNMFRYSDIYQRKPILDLVFTRSTPAFKIVKSGGDLVTEENIITPTTFNSLRTSVRVLSTFYPNRMQDVTMKFGNKVESTTIPTHPENEYHNGIDFDDDEYRDAIDPGFTMERLAYLLIGTCCGLSILCLFVVVIAIKCRRSMVEKRLKAQFRKRMYYHEKMKDINSPWQQQMFDHFMYLHRKPGESSRSTSATDSCNCRCVTWSLGARNLDSTRPLCSTDRSSLYLCGQKKLPFGAASTLRYESMLGRKRTSPELGHQQQKTESPSSDSSPENDSLDLDSADSREGDGQKQCTCIDYNLWPMPPSNVPRGFFMACPTVGRYNVGNCSQHTPVELRTMGRDIPPPVTGSNYLDRSEGVVYWSSNDERLI